MRSTTGLLTLALLAACAPAAEEPQIEAGASVDHVTQTATAATPLQTMGMAEAPRVGTDKPVVHVWKSPTCGCCALWVEHLEAAGYAVEVEEVVDVNAIKRARGIPTGAWSCHTAEVDGYLVEGHVPAATIERMLAEHPAIAGVAVPGMPVGSPGMEVPGMEPQSYQVVSFTKAGELGLYEQR